MAAGSSPFSGRLVWCACAWGLGRGCEPRWFMASGNISPVPVDVVLDMDWRCVLRPVIWLSVGGRWIQRLVLVDSPRKVRLATSAMGFFVCELARWRC